MKKIKVSIQGFKGSYSHQVVKEIFQKNNLDFELVENSTFSEAFGSIRNTGFGIIPVENSTAGFVHSAFNELRNNDFEIIGEYFLDVNHVLLGIKNSALKNIKKVFSHYQALLQVSDFLQNKSIEIIDFGDTAGGAKYISEEKNNKFGALGSEILSEIYNLDILAKNINNEKENTTRFLLIRKKDKGDILKKIKTKNTFKTSLILKVKDSLGVLYKILGCFADKNINLTKIISQPLKGERFKYSFYIEFNGKKNDIDVRYALKKIEYFTEEIIFLGSFCEVE
ncbi:MAG TPA: hypothetical protein EYG89_01100 [Bacteroidia bacterium]|nr:hypothetical protein [Bacteroidia bacterium]